MGSISIYLVCELLENRKGRIVEQDRDPVAGVVVKVVAVRITVVMIVVVVAVVVVVMTVAVVSGVMMVV